MLTGRIGVRVNWRGKLIVQVLSEEQFYPPGSSAIPVWKDATIMLLIRAMELAKERGIPPFERIDAAKSLQEKP